MYFERKFSQEKSYRELFVNLEKEEHVIRDSLFQCKILFRFRGQFEKTLCYFFKHRLFLVMQKVALSCRLWFGRSFDFCVLLIKLHSTGNDVELGLAYHEDWLPSVIFESSPCALVACIAQRSSCMKSP